jgi:acyl dehydratase
MSMTILPVEELKKCIGDEKKSELIEITQERINQFADCTDDHMFLHVDPERAKSGPFGKTVAHGFLTLSLLTRLSAEGTWIPEGMKAAINYGFNKVRFIKPVPSGSKIKDTMKLVNVEEHENGKVLVTSTHTITVEGSDKPSLIAEWIALFLV